ncbi:ABC transporter ATP-binding protein [Candidatus Symbiobacter mobilis]|uniref:ABC transporter ATP-binding protein n=1 Tax=Candidatus Symbiobacter mobilis TaxID=1436290 RepID=UPI001930B176|nr:dipeptide/oligopeptide/nickel ABC transporter ATP-binding protein [Candidatus Symbiobacter mobilis]
MQSSNVSNAVPNGVQSVQRGDTPMEVPVFSARNVSMTFGHGKKICRAVREVSFDIADGAIVSVVGGSGCGKSVLAKIMLGLYVPTAGEFFYRGLPITNQHMHWNEVQSVFQDPFSCFNQFFTIRSQLKDAFGILQNKLSKSEIEDRVDAALRAVNVQPAEIEGKYPFELSGGQMQRMLLARIFALRPKVLVADEPTSMVDACVRANILDYLMKLKQELGMTIVFVTHDIGLAYYVSDQIFIMHEGRIVEAGEPDAVALSPQHPVTVQLIEDVPDIHKDWIKR